jgi:hypothetical protein
VTVNRLKRLIFGTGYWRRCMVPWCLRGQVYDGTCAKHWPHYRDGGFGASPRRWITCRVTGHQPQANIVTWDRNRNRHVDHEVCARCRLTLRWDPREGQAGWIGGSLDQDPGGRS